MSNQQTKKVPDIRTSPQEHLLHVGAEFAGTITWEGSGTANPVPEEVSVPSRVCSSDDGPSNHNTGRLDLCTGEYH